MSLNGERQAQLEAERHERLRLEDVRREAESIAAVCGETIAGVRDPAVQQLAARGLQKTQSKLDKASSQISVDPDAAVKKIKSIRQRLNKVLTEAKSEAHRWSAEQAESQARIDEVRGQLSAAKGQSSAAEGRVSQEALAGIEQKLSEAATLQQAGRHKEAIARLDKSEGLIEQVKEASFDETVRREVVGGLLSTLKGMGFAVDGPSIAKGESDGGLVRLTGRMPSGRLATFEVDLKGGLRFDFDGYQDRTCGKELAKIEKTLQERFGVQLGPPQITWKNPDRISKGARNVPSGAARGARHG